MHAAVYTRISNDPKLEGLGVQRQLDDALALADRLGWEVVERFDDNDTSAFSGATRPGFEAMLDGMKRGEFAGLLVWHTDRLYRSMRDLERMIDVAEANRVQIRTVQGGDLDLSTSAGRMVARILGSVSRQESEHSAERRRRANEQRAAAGKWVSANRCFGYTISGEVVDSEAAMIRQAAADVLAGKSIRAVTRQWRESGVVGTRGRPFTGPNVRRLLVNPRYAAINTHRGRVVGPGEWEAIIDADTHHGLVAFLSDPSRVLCTAFEKKYMLAGVAVCGVCGSRVRHAVAGGRYRGVRRYECKAKQCVTRNGVAVDALVEQVVLKYLAGTDIHVMLDTGEKVDVGELHTQRAGLQARLDELAGMFAEGAIDGSQLRRGTSELRTQLSGIDAQIAELARRNPAADLIAAGDELQNRWDALSPDLKGKVVDELVTVTINPAPKGPKFDPQYVDIQPKVPQ